MVSIFDFDEPRAYLKARFQEFPKAGYGQSRRLAQHMNVHTTMVSQILSGLKAINPEQGMQISEFLGLSDFETEYFLLLVQLARAGNESLRKFLRKQVRGMQKKSRDLAHRIDATQTLSEEVKAIFYSHWTYAAIRQATAIPGHETVDLISEKFQLSIKRAKEIVDFLLQAGLCKESKGKLQIGPSRTHLEANSPWIKVHHQNWRQKAIESLGEEHESKLHLTGPMTLSAADAVRIREKLALAIQEVNKIVDPSPSEEIHCLNIDWFRVLA